MRRLRLLFGLCVFCSLLNTVLSDERKAGEQLKVNIKGNEYIFCWCPPGKFLMGSSVDEKKQAVDAIPKHLYDDLQLAFRLTIASETQHEVTITRGFYLLNTEVTQSMWKSVTGKNPSKFLGENLPVENVSWDTCDAFINKLNELSAVSAARVNKSWRFALPTESQWEYACRAGTNTSYSFGEVLNGDKANCDGNNPYGTDVKGPFAGQTTPAGSYPPNAWGLYDMHGNVWEWCSDWFSPSPSEHQTDPQGPENSYSKIIRGGSWDYLALRCRSAYRNNYIPAYKQNTIGLRIALIENR
ncbi:MAG: formylglycine-generating enzyme family protein [Planctomycetaceae bacterium]|jgi:formylglycine-generating enzyme required for sulfatase activity|nr:formylglycine-generating enzyme family protein [Planctomycetaceae bacterium]